MKEDYITGNKVNFKGENLTGSIKKSPDGDNI
jgi:hypothetical protein